MNEQMVKQYREPEYNTDSMFIERWSPRAFQEKEIPESILMSVFEAAKWAPSANNFQPWRFIIARSKSDLETFHSFINPGNRVWCEKAPVLTVIISKKITDKGVSASHAFDAGAAWGYLALEASRKGLITHAMGGFDRQKAREVLQVPDEYDLHCVIAIGYQGDATQLPENVQEREKPSSRRPLKESIFEGTFSEEK